MKEIDGLRLIMLIILLFFAFICGMFAHKAFADERQLVFPEPTSFAYPLPMYTAISGTKPGEFRHEKSMYQAGLTIVSEKPIPYAYEVYKEVKRITGCSGDVSLRIYPADEIQVLWALNGGEGKAPEAFTLGSVVFARKVNRSILAHEFTHAMCPKLPKPIDEIIPRWVAKEIWKH
jgi:hypothetical protein